ELALAGRGARAVHLARADDLAIERGDREVHAAVARSLDREVVAVRRRILNRERTVPRRCRGRVLLRRQDDLTVRRHEVEAPLTRGAELDRDARRGARLDLIEIRGDCLGARRDRARRARLGRVHLREADHLTVAGLEVEMEARGTLEDVELAG